MTSSHTCNGIIKKRNKRQKWEAILHKNLNKSESFEK